MIDKSADFHNGVDWAYVLEVLSTDLCDFLPVVDSRQQHPCPHNVFQRRSCPFQSTSNRLKTLPSLSGRIADADCRAVSINRCRTADGDEVADPYGSRETNNRRIRTAAGDKSTFQACLPFVMSLVYDRSPNTDAGDLCTPAQTPRIRSLITGLSLLWNISCHLRSVLKSLLLENHIPLLTLEPIRSEEMSCARTSLPHNCNSGHCIHGWNPSQ